MIKLAFSLATMSDTKIYNHQFNNYRSSVSHQCINKEQGVKSPGIAIAKFLAVVKLSAYISSDVGEVQLNKSG